MANLFVVFTPLQVVVAQQIIRQEKLSDNVMLESYLANFTHFLEIYQMVRIEDMWSKVISFENWASWDYGGENLLKNIFKVKKRAGEITRILENHKIDTIYFADFQNQTNRFSCVWLNRLGYKVVFYEEGYSHYIPRVGYPPSSSFFHKVYENALDWCYYLPLYGIKFAEWRCYPNKDYHGLPIYQRYSIVPDIHHEPYDKILTCEPIASVKLQTFIAEELGSLGREKILLLTDPMTEVLDSRYKDLYFDTIRESLAQYTDKHIYIKYHPRDSKEDKDRIIKIVEDLGCEYSILGAQVNIPVEFYLQNAIFANVLFFNTSTYFYNGFLFPETNFVKLLPVLYEKCFKVGVQDLRQMESLIEKMKV